jgi:hypothetical protein
LTTEEEPEGVSFICIRARTLQYGICREVLQFIEEKMGRILTGERLRTFLGSDTSEVVYRSIRLQEDPRLSIFCEFFMRYFEVIWTHVDGVNPELVFNLDGTGNNDWAEKRNFPHSSLQNHRTPICIFRSIVPSNIKICSFS